MVDDEIMDKATTNKTVDGELVQRVIQSQGRVDVPDRFLEEMGLSEGDKVHLFIDDGGIKVVESSLDNIR